MRKERNLPKEKAVVHVKDHIRSAAFAKKYAQLIELAPEAEMWVVVDSDTSMDMLWLKPFDKEQVDRGGAIYQFGVCGSEWEQYFNVLNGGESMPAAVLQ